MAKAAKVVRFRLVVGQPHFSFWQFDWSHEVVLLSGVTVIVKFAHVRLCHSRMLFVRA